MINDWWGCVYIYMYIYIYSCILNHWRFMRCNEHVYIYISYTYRCTAMRSRAWRNFAALCPVFSRNFHFSWTVDILSRIRINRINHPQILFIQISMFGFRNHSNIPQSQKTADLSIHSEVLLTLWGLGDRLGFPDRSPRAVWWSYGSSITQKSPLNHYCWWKTMRGKNH